MVDYCPYNNFLSTICLGLILQTVKNKVASMQLATFSFCYIFLEYVP